MTVMSFARPYTAWDTEPDADWPLLEFIDSTTGERLAIDYPSIHIFSYKPGDTLAVLHPHCVVILEGQHLAALFEALGEHGVRTIRTFCAERFQPTAPGAPMVERLTIARRPPTPEDWERWVYRR